MRCIILALSILFGLTGIVQTATAEIIAKCKPLKGYAYWSPGSMIAKDKVGWGTDSISSSSIVLVRNGKDYDIRFRDLKGSESGTREQGGKVFLVNQTASSIVLLAIYGGGTTEIYSYNFQTKKLSYFADKLGGMIPSAKLLIGPCTG